MPRPSLANVLVISATVAVVACTAATQSGPNGSSIMAPVSGKPERSIRRDIPITNAIRKAFAAGTRDSTGRPGRTSWQLRTDSKINARLEPSTQRLTGRETVVITNNSPDSLTQIGLRLDMNHFPFTSPRAAPWVASEETDGMVVTRMAVNGQPVNLNPAQQGRGGGRGGPPTENALTGARSTLATIVLMKPIAAHSKATVEVEWNHKIPGAPGNY